MPDFIKGLTDVQEDCWAVFVFFKCFVYCVCKAVALLYCWVGSAKAELVGRYPVL